MNLTFFQLIKFDLIDNLYEKLFDDENLLTEFYDIFGQINSIDEFINDSPSFPGSTDKILREELVSVVGATLSIEGILLDKDEIEKSFEKADSDETLHRKEQEADNSRRVYEFIADRKAEDIDFSEQLIKQLHKIFTDGLNYPGNTPGVYRNSCPTFGHPRKNSLCRTESEVKAAMTKFAGWLNKENPEFLDQNSFITAIMAHYYLTEIHPFGDGNGRTARALEALILYSQGINHYCFWSLANFWSANRNEYLDHLHNIRVTCDPWSFIIWGMKGYLEKIEQIKAKVLKKQKQLMLLDYTGFLLRTKKEQKIKINERIFHIIELLIQYNKIPLAKFYNTPEIRAIYSKSSSSSKSRDLKKMTTLKLIKIYKEDNIEVIEPNFQILNRVNYNI